ncbi:unnamed protein product [Brassica oleracea]
MGEVTVVLVVLAHGRGDRGAGRPRPRASGLGSLSIFTPSHDLQSYREDFFHKRIMDNNTSSLMLIDNNGSFEIDDKSHMDLVTTTRPTDAAAAGDTDDGGGSLLSQPGIRRRRKKSMVWEHFTIETTSPGSSKACCKHCRKSFAYITGQKLAGTSHLKRHIQLGICPMSRGGDQLTQISPDAKDVVVTTPPKKRQRASSTPLNAPLDQDRCYGEMAKMIIMHEYPLHMVEHSGFARFVRALRPQLGMATFHAIHADCVAIYLSEKQKLSAFIGEIPGQVNLTVDLWSSNQSVGYAFVTGHFIDKDWNLTRRLLNVALVPSPDSDFALNQPVAACLADWNLERRLCSLTVGESVVNKSAVENLRCCLSARNQHVMNGQLLLGSCYARLLSSMARDALGAEDLQTPIKKVRDSVKHVKTRDSCSERFDELKAQLQTRSEKDLRIDNQTKWDTTYSMLLAAYEHKEVFSCLGNCDLEYKISISPEEWRKIEVLCSCLKILFDAASVLTGPTRRLTANDLYHEMTKLQLELSHTAMSEEPDVRNLATPLREKFDEYWRGCFLLLAVAVVMDPRFKMKLIEFSFSKAYGEDAEKWIRSVDDAVHELYHDYAEQSHSLLEAYVAHGNDGFSETEVHFHPEYNHSNELSHDQIYEQPGGDSNLLNEKPRDHALDGHESQEAAQTDRTQLVEELPLENQQVEDTDMTQETQPVDEILEDTQSVQELAQEAQLVEEKHADSDILVEEVEHETQPVEEMVENTEPVEQVVQEAQLVEEKHGDSDIQPVEELGHETQPVEEMVENTEPVEEVAQEAQLVEEKHGDSEIQAVKELEHETQPVEEMVENTEPVEEVAQEAQLVEEKHDDIQPVEEAEHDTQPVEEIIEDTQPVEDLAQETQPVETIPEHIKNPQNGDSQSHAMPQEEAAFTISQEGHHVDVLLQEGHHLEASSQEFPLITIGDGFSDFELYISEVGSREQMKSELDQYLEESLIPRSPDFEVLGWWSLNRTKYPTLSKMAADVLSLPFCTVSPDSVFDTDVKKMDNYRSSLGHVTLEALFCAKDWLMHSSNASTSENNMKREPVLHLVFSMSALWSLGVVLELLIPFITTIVLVVFSGVLVIGIYLLLIAVTMLGWINVVFVFSSKKSGAYDLSFLEIESLTDASLPFSVNVILVNNVLVKEVVDEDIPRVVKPKLMQFHSQNLKDLDKVNLIFAFSQHFQMEKKGQQHSTHDSFLTHHPVLCIIALSVVFIAIDPFHMSPIGGREFKPMKHEVAPYKQVMENWPRDNLSQLGQHGKLEFVDRVFGPESLEFDGLGRGPYTGLADGRVVRWLGEAVGWETFSVVTSKWSEEACARGVDSTTNKQWKHEKLCGRPLGLRFDKETGNLYIADAYYGLLVVGPEGGVATPLATHVEGKPILFANDLDIHRNGSIFFTDTSKRYDRANHFFILLEGESTGRLLRYDPPTKTTHIVQEGLAFPNGIQLSKDQSFLLFTETTNCRLVKYWLEGAKTGEVEVVADLPGFPDNVRMNKKGEFWVAIDCCRTPAQEVLTDNPWIKSIYFRLPIPMKLLAKAMGMKMYTVISRFDEDGEVLEVLEDRQGKVMKLVSEVREVQGKLWIGTVAHNHIASVPYPLTMN